MSIFHIVPCLGTKSSVEHSSSYLGHLGGRGKKIVTSLKSAQCLSYIINSRPGVGWDPVSRKQMEGRNGGREIEGAKEKEEEEEESKTCRVYHFLLYIGLFHT